MECKDELKIGQVWINKASQTKVLIVDIKDNFVIFAYGDMTSDWRQSKSSFCDLFEKKLLLQEDNSNDWVITDVTSDWSSTNTVSTNIVSNDIVSNDIFLIEGFYDTTMSSSLTLPKSENKSCSGGEIWYNGRNLMTCKNGKGEAIATIPQSMRGLINSKDSVVRPTSVSLFLGGNLEDCNDGEVWYHKDNKTYNFCIDSKPQQLSLTKEKGNDMFTFGNLCILIVLMFVVAKLAQRVNWYVFLYPIKKFFGFSKRTAKKVEEELNGAKEEWNKIEE